MKKLLAIVMASVMLAGLFTGCGESTQADDAAKATTKEATTEQTTDDNSSAETAESSEPVEFEFFGTIYSPYVEESVIFDEWMKAANCKVDFTWNQSDSAEQQLAARVANQDLPEVVFSSDVGNLASQGLLMPITDLIDEYMPNFRALMTDEDMVTLTRYDDGEIYGIGLVQPDLEAAYSTMIRKDWLENLGLEEPKTWEDWVDVWTAFKEEDANGNGDKTDEVPLAMQYSMLYMLEAPFGINSNGNFSIYKGEYTYDPEHPNYEAFLDGMRELYEKGILCPEFVTCDQAMLSTIGANNTLGSTVYWAEQAKNFSLACREIGDEDALFQCVTPIVGPKGDAAILARAKLQQNTIFTIECGDRLPEILKAFDYLYSEEGIKLTNFGIEGTHHEVVDGKPVVKAPYNESFTTARSNDLIPSIIPFCFIKDSYMQYLLGGASVDSLDDPGKSFVDGLTINDDYYYQAPVLYKTEAWLDYSDLVTEQKALRDQYIMGSISKDEYNAKYEELKANGLGEVIDQAKAAYASVAK